MRTVSPVLIYVTCWNMPTSVGWSEFSLWMGLWSVSWTLFPSQCYWVHSEQQTPQMLLFCHLLFYQMTLKAVKWGNFCTESKEATKVERVCGDDVSWSSLPVWRHESSEMWRFISRLFVEGLDFPTSEFQWCRSTERVRLDTVERFHVSLSFSILISNYKQNKYSHV